MARNDEDAMMSDPSIRAPEHRRLEKLYDDDFYHSPTSLRSARLFLGHLWKYFQPKSVIDIGCGRGAWLMACHELGSVQLYGFDGPWNSGSKLLDPAIQFSAIDLNDTFDVPHNLDLAISLEVAEHLHPGSSNRFVENLTKASKTVLFGAACPGQGGINHINERPQSYWAGLFRELGYVPFDLFRSAFWGDRRISFWYPQNTFLYVALDSRPYEVATSSGISVVEDIGFMDCVHPRLFEARMRRAASFRAHLTDLLPSMMRAVGARLRQTTN